MSQLFTPFRLRSLELANRVVVSPMCQYSAVDGLPNEWHEVHLGGLATGGAGVVFIEATAVSDIGRITPGCLGLWSPGHELALTALVDLVKHIAPVPMAIQLGHAGRKASCAEPWHGGRQLPAGGGDWQTIAPSAIPHYPGERAPRPMTEEDLEQVKREFVEAALRAQRSGCVAIELHAAHGYLLHQFLSPLANQRSDRYGGSLDHRMRYPLEVFAAVRAALPDGYPLGVRVSATDWMEYSGQPSWTLDQTLEFARALEAAGCDWLDVTTGGLAAGQKLVAAPLYHLPFAVAVKRATRMPVMTVGMVREPAEAEGIVARGDADLVALARGFMMNPRWTWRAAQELGARLPTPPQNWRAETLHGQPIFLTGK